MLVLKRSLVALFFVLSVAPLHRSFAYGYSKDAPASKDQPLFDRMPGCCI
jgi:hypothetical protein